MGWFWPDQLQEVIIPPFMASSKRRSLAVLTSEPEIPLYEGDVEADLQVVARNRLAEGITGGLSWPSKLPCPAWGISATHCKIGSVLAREKGTVCNRCYSLKNRFLFPSVQDKLEHAYQGLAHRLWTPAMVFLIRWFANKYFRWFHAGDIQGPSHLRNIITICENTRDILHWLPTREYELIRSHKGPVPDNLTIRLSAHRIDGDPPDGWPSTSTVAATSPKPGSYVCPSPEQKNFCGECRECWNPQTRNISYWLH
jgi:hypothetical protein